MDPAMADGEDEEDGEGVAARRAFGGDGPAAGRAPAGASAMPQHSEALDKFYKELDRAKQAIQRVKGATAETKTLLDEAMSAIGNDAEQACSEKLARVLTQANKDCALAKRVLEGLKSETQKMDRKKLQADIRIRENMHATTLQNLVASVRAYQSAQQEYKMKLREKAARQVRVAKPDATNEEVDAAMRSGDVNAVYRTAILEPGSDIIAQAYLNAADRYQDVLKLERSVEELHRMFMDLAVLVNHQGELLDNIEAQVFQAKDYIESGNVRSALRLRRRLRRLRRRLRRRRRAAAGPLTHAALRNNSKKRSRRARRRGGACAAAS